MKEVTVVGEVVKEEIKDGSEGLKGETVDGTEGLKGEIKDGNGGLNGGEGVRGVLNTGDEVVEGEKGR